MQANNQKRGRLIDSRRGAECLTCNCKRVFSHFFLRPQSAEMRRRTRNFFIASQSAVLRFTTAGSQFDEPAAQAARDGFGAGCGAEFSENRADVKLDRVLGNA